MCAVLTRSNLDISLGMRFFYTEFSGLHGEIRVLPWDFIVQEVAFDGSVAPLSLTESQPVRVNWGEGRYSVLVLEKCCRETISTVLMLQKLLKSKVGFAGMKDKLAITSQFITVSAELQRMPTIPGLALTYAGRSDFHLKRGMLKGNQFTLTVRNIASDDLGHLKRWLDDALKEISYGGVPGYFGYQRFGVSRPVTHLVGRHIVRGEFEGAVDAILKELSRAECLETSMVRQLLKRASSYKCAKSIIPRSMVYEHSLIELLDRYGNPKIAIKKLPTCLLNLFVQGYQAYLFNRSLSALVEDRGSLRSLKIGDVVGLLNSWGEAAQLLKVSLANINKVEKLVNTQKAALLLQVPGAYLKEPNPYLIEIMKEEGVEFSHFKAWRAKGGLRQCIAYPYIKYCSAGFDEVYRGRLSYTVSLFLPRGFYATLVLRELIKPEEPSACGF